MKIDDALVGRVATLARLELRSEDLARYGEQLGKILEYVEQLKGLNVDGVEPLTHAGEYTNVFREDAPRPSLPQKEALENAPEQDKGCFVVPRVIEKS